jgi:hypothetical protein
MPISVKSQGETFTFQDGTTEAQIGEALDSHFAGNSQPTQQAPAAIPQTQEEMQAAQPGIFQGLVNVGRAISGRDRKTEETRQATELIDAPAADVGAKLGFNLALNFNSDEIESVIKEQFPEAPIRKDQLGSTFVTINDKEYIINKPGLSKQDLGATIGNIISFLPASRAAALGQTVLRRLGIGAVTSTATQAGIETGQAVTGGEFNIGEVALASAAGGLGEIPSAIAASRRLSPTARALLPDVTDADAATAKAFQEQSGVALRPAQVSESQKDQLVEFLLSQDPQTSKKFGESLKNQSKETHEGLITFLDELATTNEAAGAALDVRNMSTDAIKSASIERTRKTKPIFKQAFTESADAGLIIDTKPIIANLSELAQVQSGGVKAQINQLRGVISEATQPGDLKTNFEKLHNAKKEIDRLIAAGTKGATPTMDGFTEGVYKDARKQLNETLRDQSNAYAAGNDLFIELSPGVEALEQGVGDISKIDPGKLSQVAKKIFNLDEFIANPDGFNKTKEIISNVNPEAWTALTRSRFQQDLAEIGVDSLEDALDPNINFIQQLWSKSFKGKEKTLFRNALDGDMKKNYTAMADVFNRARKRPGQSATAQLQDLKASLEGNKSVAKVIDGMMNPNAAGIFERVFGVPQVRSRNTKILADIVTDPKWMDRMTEIRRLGMDTPKGGAAFAQLFRDALQAEQPEERTTGAQQ